MNEQDRLYKLDNGSDTAKWAASKIRDLEVRLYRIQGILHGDTMYEYSDIEEMRGLCNVDELPAPSGTNSWYCGGCGESDKNKQCFGCRA